MQSTITTNFDYYFCILQSALYIILDIKCMLDIKLYFKIWSVCSSEFLCNIQHKASSSRAYKPDFLGSSSVRGPYGSSMSSLQQEIQNVNEGGWVGGRQNSLGSVWGRSDQAELAFAVILNTAENKRQLLSILIL